MPNRRRYVAALAIAGVAVIAVLALSNFRNSSSEMLPPEGAATFGLIGSAGDEYQGQNLRLSGTVSVGADNDLRAFDRDWNYVLRFDIIDGSAAQDGQFIDITCIVGPVRANGGPFPGFPYIQLAQCHNTVPGRDR